MMRHSTWDLRTARNPYVAPVADTPAPDPKPDAESAANSPMHIEGVVGNSPAILKVCRAIERVAPTDVSVVLDR